MFKLGALGKKGILSIFRVNKEFELAYDKIKEEFEEHLQSINENTNEIHSNYEYICELENKISKLNEKIDEMNMNVKKLLSTDKNPVVGRTEFIVQPLSIQERKVFLTLYTNEKPLSYKQIAEETNFTESLVSQYITNLIEKGIALFKQYNQGKALVGMDPQFKEAQAKRKLVILD